MMNKGYRAQPAVSQSERSGTEPLQSEQSGTEPLSQRPSRRSFLTVAGTATFSLAALDAGIFARAAAPAAAATAYLAAAPPYPLNAYHDVDGAGHQARFKTLYAQGYRVISFSVYGDAADPRYAAVWLKRMGPPWTMIHGANAAQVQQFFTTWAAKGYNPTIISATGTGDSTVFALVMERTTGPGTQSTSVSKDNLRRGDPYAQDPTQDTLEYWNRWARDPKTRTQYGHYFRLRWLTMYGDPADLRFAAIWEPDQSAVTWNGGLAPLTLADAQSIYNAESAQRGRLAFVTRSYDGQYMQLYRDDLIGPTAARGELTSADYQAQFTTLVGQGYYPLCVQGSGPTADPRFAAIFVKGESPAARVWTARGSAPAPTVDVAAPAIDAAIQVFMQANGVRGAALAIVNGVKLVYARGYTWAEPGYPVTRPTTLFRVASMAKVITSILIHQLIEAKRLHYDDTLGALLNLTTPTGGAPVDAGFNGITVAQLLNHTSGLTDGFAEYDPQVAAAFHTSLPVTKAQTASFMATKPRAFTDGKPHYSNFGYFLLTLIVQQGYHAPFMNVVHNRLIVPLHLARLRRSRSLLSAQTADEARYHDGALGLGPSVMTADQPMAPAPYGTINLENGDGVGGLSVAAVDYARIVAALNVATANPILQPDTITAMLKGQYGWDLMSPIGGGTYHGVKGGYLPGLQSSVSFTSGGVSYVVYWNKDRLQEGQFYPSFPELEAAIAATTFAAPDLFPIYSMPSL